MAIRTPERTKRRTPLSRERVLHAAMELADAGGLATLTMRMLGRALGVEAMSLYHHVANKDDLLDGMVDHVFGEIGLPPLAISIGGRRCASGRSRRGRGAGAAPLGDRAGGVAREAAGRGGRCATTTRCWAACAAAGFSIPLTGGTPTRRWTATSTASRCNRRACRSTRGRHRRRRLAPDACRAVPC